MVNVVVVGDGESSIEHIDAWSQIKNVDVICVDKHKLVELVSDLRPSDVNIIDLCIQVNEMADMIRKLYREGLQFFCQLRSETTQDEASAIIKESRDKNIHLSVENTLRFSPEFADARNQVKNGSIGKSGVIRLSIGASHPGGQEDIFSELGNPLFDWLLWTFGNVERIMAKHVKKERQDGSPLEYALVSLRMEDSSLVHIELSWAKTKKETSFELTGDKGMLVFNSKENNPIEIQLTNSDDNLKLEEIILAKTTLQRQFEFVAEWAEMPKKVVKADKNVLKVFQITEAARQSANTGQPVSLKEVYSHENRND